MVKGGPGSVQLPFAGFGRLSNGKTTDWMVAIPPCGSELARDGGLTADRVHIRFRGNGYLGFRPDGESLSKSAKVTKALLPHHLVPRLGSACPHSGIAPWARREGPSMAQRGYPGIHAGMPTPQCLRSASVVNGAPRSTSAPRRPGSRPGSPGRTPIQMCGSRLAREGGLTVDRVLAAVLRPSCGSEPAREGGLTTDLALAAVLQSKCGGHSRWRC